VTVGTIEEEKTCSLFWRGTETIAAGKTLGQMQTKSKRIKNEKGFWGESFDNVVQGKASLRYVRGRHFKGPQMTNTGKVKGGVKGSSGGTGEERI